MKKVVSDVHLHLARHYEKLARETDSDIMREEYQALADRQYRIMADRDCGRTVKKEVSNYLDSKAYLTAWLNG